MTESKTIINSQGKILFYGLQQFISDIVNDNNCFICGATPTSKPFNDEHIIPDWILRRFTLHAKTITLPNGTTMRYGQYKIPCCQDCNSDLGKTYEIPISELLNQTYEDITSQLAKDPNLGQLLFKWISLIFIKTHLKDKLLLVERDARKNTGAIGDRHYWEDMHHIHCIARSHYSGALIHPDVYGSTWIVPAILTNNERNFDYVDSEVGKVVMIRMNDFCIISVLNDSCAALNLFANMINKVTAALSSFQIREIVAHLKYLNINLKERPIYKSVIIEKSQYNIIAEIPDNLSLIDEDERIASAGEFLEYYVREMIGEIQDREIILKEIAKGKRGYLLDENGEFVNHNIK